MLLAAAVGSVVASIGGMLRAQPAVKPVRVGVLGITRANPLVGVFVSALRDLGWIEGTNIAYENRWSEGRNERYSEFSAELVRLNVDVIVSAGGATATLAAMAATTLIPIVFINAANPVKFGLVASLARPEANVTGIAIASVDWGKWLQIAHEAMPVATRVAVIANPSNLTYADYAAQNQAAAQRMGLQLQLIPVAGAGEIAEAFAAMRRMRAELLVFGPDGLYMTNARQIIELAAANRLPVIGPDRMVAELGGIASYGFDARLSVRRAAEYVDRILKGAKPAQLPVEQPSRFELVVNVAAAKNLGLTLPQSLLLQADEVLR